MIHIYCGEGKGKTTASCGLALRAASSGMKVLYTSFFKDGESSEVKLLSSTDNITYIKPERVFGRYKTLNDTERSDASLYYDSLLQRIIVLAKDFGMVVLDEVISSYNYGAVNRVRLLDFLKGEGEEREIVLTGRGPSEELVKLADYVTEMKKIKHPYDKGIYARKGIEY